MREPHLILSTFIDTGLKEEITDFLNTKEVADIIDTLKTYERLVSSFKFHELYNKDRQTEQLNNTVNILIPFLKAYIKNRKR